MNDSRTESYMAIRFFIGLSVILLLLLLFCICTPCLSPCILGKTDSKNVDNYYCIILKVVCYAVTVVALTFVCKFLLDYEAKINHDELSYEKAKMVIEKQKENSVVTSAKKEEIALDGKVLISIERSKDMGQDISNQGNG